MQVSLYTFEIISKVLQRIRLIPLCVLRKSRFEVLNHKFMFCMLPLEILQNSEMCRGNVI